MLDQENRKEPFFSGPSSTKDREQIYVFSSMSYSKDGYQCIVRTLQEGNLSN